jgi:prefoldin alpha subunit
MERAVKVGFPHRQLHARHSGLKQAEGRFRQSKDALAAISKDDEGRRMLVPLTQSLYVPGELGDPDQLLVELGTGYYIEKTQQGATELLDRKIGTVSKNAEDINTVVASKQQNYDAIVQMMQVKMAQIQERRSELQRQQDRSG